MSGFSAVDDSQDPSALVRYLDDAATGLSGIKHYVLAAHTLRRPRGPILDVGCGAGHDLALFADAGLDVVGIDPSAVMVEAARARLGRGRARVLRAGGATLPFRTHAFSGCRIERVLMHVDDPADLVTEALRCLEPGGLVTAFEPDWSSFRVESDARPGPTAWISGVKHPDMGARLSDVLTSVGCDVLDRVEEQSVWRSFARFAEIVGFPASVERAAAEGRVDRADADRWVAEQRARDASGDFSAVMTKVLVVAQKRR